MGTVIRSDAARTDIVDDAKKTLAAAKAKGDDVGAQAEERLSPLITLFEAHEAEAKASDAKATDARARRTAANRTTDDVVVEVSDDLYEAGGRRRNDPYLALVMPGGAGPITDATLELQPVRMRITARLLGKAKHPRIPKATLDGAASRLASAADSLDVVINATRDDLIAADVDDQAMTTLARLMRNELMGLKRFWLGAGWSETEVHEIIPDRPEPAPKKKET